MRKVTAHLYTRETGVTLALSHQLDLNLNHHHRHSVVMGKDRHRTDAYSGVPQDHKPWREPDKGNFQPGEGLIFLQSFLPRLNLIFYPDAHLSYNRNPYKNALTSFLMTWDSGFQCPEQP